MLALVVNRRELADVLEQALAIDVNTAEAILALLSFHAKSPDEKGHRGRWAAPLVPTPGQDKFALALPALATSYPLRKVEAWLGRGGLDDTWQF